MRMSLARKFLLLLLLVLSPHINSSSIIKFLPGFDGPLPFDLETGYIGIGEEKELQMFYYFIKSEKNPEEDPLIIWLTGGPGCSCTLALFYENGPVTIQQKEAYNGSMPSLISTTYSWTKMANMLFLDQPSGIGFSYKRSPVIDKSSDTVEVVRIHEFLQQWLSEHPEFYSNSFYVAGDSYSGKIVPALVQQISKENYVCCKPPINLQGYVLGNPVTDIEFDHNSRIPFAHGIGLISDELYESLKRNCKGKYDIVDPRNTKCLKLVEEYHKCTDRICEEHVLLPRDENWVDSYLRLTYWINNESVREALHIRKGTIGKWIRCDVGIHYDINIASSVPYHMNNSISGYRSLIFSGDHDLTVPYLGTQAWIRLLKYPIIDDWGPWMINDQIAGYTRTYANKMTFATVKGGGHTAQYKPEESFIMFQRWISGQPL